MDIVAHILGPFAGIEVGYTVRLVVAALLGMIVGLQRSITGKHAGMRTYAMVSLGAALFVTLGTLASYELSVFPGINPLQIAASIVIGIGFIGSGLAVYRGEAPVELTTASGIWVVAAVGMACGFGLYISAIAATILAVLIFTYFSRLERTLQQRYGIGSK
jgi:putative Mg2+ transporter-C (MgtC) family protein